MATTTFDNLITFSRGSNATLTGPTGLVQWAPMNLLTNSQDFDAAAWLKTNASVTANNSAAPDGTLTADKLIENSAAATQHYNYQQLASQSAGTYTYSIYVKAAERTKFRLAQSVTTGYSIDFDLTAITATSVAGGAVGTITSVGGGWYRCTSTFTSSVSIAFTFVIYLEDAAGSVTYTGDGTSGLFIWGAQLELGTAATTYNNTSVKNLLGFSEAFDNAAWTKTRASMVTGAAANPLNGLFTAQKLMEDTTASNSHAVYRSVTITAAPHTLSIYAKAAGRNWFYLVCTTAANAGAYFNLATGEIGTVSSGYTAAITSVGNGWYRCSITFTGTAATWYPNVYLANADNSSSYTGDGSSGIYLFGAQLSNSASLDPYVPTPGAAPSSTAYYGPRFDYDPVTLQPKGLLVEEQRTNLLTYSDQFNNAAWVKNNASVTANAGVSPDGSANADKVIADTTSSEHYAEQVLSVNTNQAYTTTVFAKPDTSVSYFAVAIVAVGSPATVSTWNIQNTAGVLTTSSSGGLITSTTITPVGNGWYRLAATYTLSGTVTSHRLRLFGLTTSGSTVATGNGVNGVLYYGAQVEAGAFATSYIPTVASTVTRSADVATITGQNFSQWYGQSEGTFVVSSFPLKPTAASGTPRIFTASDGTENNRVMADLPSTNARGIVSTGGVNQATLTIAYSANVNLNLALAYRASDFAFAKDGATPATATSGTVPSGITGLQIGATATATSQFNGHIRSIRYFPVRAADFQLQALTQ